MSALLGTVLSGRYRLEVRIGSGGMSTVYRACDEVLDRSVAVKVLNREVARESDQLERFRREARAVAQLNHPHVVTVIDAGEDDGHPYIVFEYVEGETLKARIRRCGRLPVAESVAYAIEIARALGAAHGRGIVHRDVKPQNVLIDPEGSAKVTDFGIARTLDQDGLTAEGRVLGTTDYVSPEQALGHVVTGQSDLYSLGIVLWEMLTGDVPFSGDNQVAVAMKHVREELPDVQVYRPDTSTALASVIDRATDKDLERRYPDANAMMADLEQVLAIETARAGGATGEATSVLQTLPPSARKRLPLRMRVPRAVVVLLSVLALAFIGVGAYLLTQQTSRGTGTLPDRDRGEGKAKQVPLSEDAASDFDPDGDGTEHPEQLTRLIDADKNSAWTTETYSAGDLQKDGVGVFLDAKPQTRAEYLQVITPTPGFPASVYVADGDAPPEVLAGWTKVGEDKSVAETQRIAIRGGDRPRRYYLLWITGLPPGGESVEISELSIFR